MFDERYPGVYVPLPNTGGVRIYGQSAANPRGDKERKDNCLAEPYSCHSFVSMQCTRKRGHGPDGLFCKQHAKMIEKAKEKE